MKCPIAYWRAKRPNAPALSGLTYSQLDRLIGELPPSPYLPSPSIPDIACFFSALRKRVPIYPLSHRLPHSQIQSRQAFFTSKRPPPNCATLIETSSKTKIACHTLENHLASAHAAIEALDITQESRYLLNLPLFHISGVAAMLRTFVAGAHLLLPQDKIEPTHISMVPTQLFRLLQAKSPQPNWKCLLVGGAPLPKHLLTKALDLGLPVYQTYGMTECASMVALARPGEELCPLPHIQFKLAKDGEIHLRGPSLFQGYLNSPAHQGWFPTKDLGALKNGQLTLLGRKDRQFISGGENIQPEEIEQTLMEHEAILDAQVQAATHPEYGMRPKAQVQSLKPVSSSELITFLEERLPRFKIPDEFEIGNHPLALSKQAEMANHGL